MANNKNDSAMAEGHDNYLKVCLAEIDRQRRLITRFREYVGDDNWYGILRVLERQN